MLSNLLAQVKPDFNVTNPTPYRTTGTGQAAEVPLQALISNLLGTATIIAGLAFLVYLVIGGLQWITAAGDKAALDSAKDKLTNGFIGLAIVVFAWAVVSIVQAVLGLDILNFKFPG